MRIRFVFLVPVLAVAGCGLSGGNGGLNVKLNVKLNDARFGGAPLRGEVGFLLLGAKEGEDIGEMDAPPPPDAEGVEEDGVGKEPRREAGAAGGFALKVGGGMAFPGGELGSAMSGYNVPSYPEIWTTGSAFELLAEFGSGRKVNPYAQLSISQFTGQRWTNPDDASDSWVASDGSVTMIAGGARFGGRYYGKAALGLLLWPEVKRIDYFSGYEEAILESGAVFAFALGGGAEFKLGKLKAYVDAEFLLGMAPERGENAVVFWPKFEPGGMNSFRLAGGVGFSF